MKRRLIGRSELAVAPIGLGAGNFGGATDPREAHRILDVARDVGINLIDTADAYKGGASESIIGEYLKANNCRQEFVIATKVGSKTSVPDGLRPGSRAHVLAACEASLRRLGVDCIDLYQLHRPDFDTPLVETLGALADLRAQGKIRYAGTSTFPAWLVATALSECSLDTASWLVCEQPPYNLLDRRAEVELVPMAREHGLGLIPWSGAGGGILAGRYSAVGSPAPGSRLDRQGPDSRFGTRVTPRSLDVAEALQSLARDCGRTPVQLALAWAMTQEGITAPLYGARTAAQLAEVSLAVSQPVSSEVLQAADRLNAPGAAVSDFFNSASWYLSSADAVRGASTGPT